MGLIPSKNNSVSETRGMVVRKYLNLGTAFEKGTHDHLSFLSCLLRMLEAGLKVMIVDLECLSCDC